MANYNINKSPVFSTQPIFVVVFTTLNTKQLLLFLARYRQEEEENLRRGCLLYRLLSGPLWVSSVDEHFPLQSPVITLNTLNIFDDVELCKVTLGFD